jgi:cytoskeletal protein RodZ
VPAVQTVISSLASRRIAFSFYLVDFGQIKNSMKANNLNLFVVVTVAGLVVCAPMVQAQTAPTAPSSPTAPTAPSSPQPPSAPLAPTPPENSSAPAAATAPDSPTAPSAPPAPAAPTAPGGDNGAAQAQAQARAARNAGLQTLLASFTLTPLQKAQINDALKSQRDQIMALRTDPTVNDSNRMDKIREIIRSTDATLQTIFSPEQFQKWQEAVKDMRPPGMGVTKPGMPLPPKPAARTNN